MYIVLIFFFQFHSQLCVLNIFLNINQ